MNNIKSWKNNPWTIGITTTILGFILTIIRDFNKEKPILSTFWQLLKATYNFIIKLLEFEIKIWSLLVLIILILIVRSLAKKMKRKSHKNVFNFKNYTVDNFKGFKWHWMWRYDSFSSHYVADSIYPECNNCDTGLLVNDFHFYYCPRCDKQYRNLSPNIQKDIEGLIIDNLDKKKEEFQRQEKLSSESKKHK